MYVYIYSVISTFKICMYICTFEYLYIYSHQTLSSNIFNSQLLLSFKTSRSKYICIQTLYILSIIPYIFKCTYRWVCEFFFTSHNRHENTPQVSLWYTYVHICMMNSALFYVIESFSLKYLSQCVSVL